MSDAAIAAGDPAALAAPFAGACWRDVRLRRDALPGLSAQVLLHAGPPFEPGALLPPVRQAAVQALLFEGLAADPARAADMLDRGEVTLQPAQDHGVMTPLAQVVSASMPLAMVGDAQRVAYAPLVEGPPPTLGAIGDSAVLDFCGLGGQAMHLAPALLAEWAALLDGDPRERRQALIDTQTGVVDPERAAAGPAAVQVNLAILDADGRLGLLGRGFYRPPPALFSTG